MKILSSISKGVAEVLNLYADIDGKASKGIINYGDDNALPQRLLKAVYASPSANAAISVLSSFILGEGVEQPVEYRNINGNTLNEIIADAADSTAMFDGRAWRVLYDLSGKVRSVEILPFECVRKTEDGRFAYNRNFGKRNFKAEETFFFDSFNPNITPEERIAIIEKEGGIFKQKGEVYYSFRNKPGNNIYPIPQHVSGIEDMESEAGLLLNERGNILNGFNADLILFTPIFDSQTKDDAGKTQFDYFVEQMNEFRKPGQKKILHIMTESGESRPVISPVPIKEVVDAIHNARERVPRAICRACGVPPMLIGLPNPERMANTTALANYMQLFNLLVKKQQQAIEADLKKLLGFELKIKPLNIFS